MHWVSIKHAVKAEVRVYDRLFLDEAPDSHSDKNFMDFVNPHSLDVIKSAFVEPFLKEAVLGDKFQFQRLGYFTLDADANPDHLIFNKTVGLRDSWAKQKPVSSQENNQASQNNPQGQGQRSPLGEINKIGKKLANLSGDKLENAKAKILELAENVSYEEISPLFNTAAKKKGTRIAVMIALRVQLKNGKDRNEAIDAFIESALQDENELLKGEAELIGLG